MSNKILTVLLLLLGVLTGKTDSFAAGNEQDFSTSHTIYNEAKPWCFWYWMHGAVSREGITADLEAMQNAGLGGCYLMPIYGPDRQPELGGTLRQGTEAWWQMVDFALQEAARLDLKVGMHICDGFALAGGPWISPAQSMQMVVSTDTLICLPKSTRYSESLLPLPYQGKTAYYRDIAAYAISAGKADKEAVAGFLEMEKAASSPVISSPDSAFEYNPANGRIKCREACSFTYTFTQPISVTGLEITTFNNSMQALRMKVFAADSNGQFRFLKEIVPPRHGWQNYDFPTTVALPTTSTRKLHFQWTPEGSEAGSEDLDNAKWGKVLKIEHIRVLTTPCIDDWEGKSGRVWRVSSQKQSLTSAESYVQPDQLIRLTPGCKLPKGNWRIVRIGHTSTGHENATGGDARGLECDKFSRSATQSQLDHWFVEAFRRCNPYNVRRALKVMHIDSWECGCQNWSDSIPASLIRPSADAGQVINFARYFEATQGYDLMPFLPLLAGIPMHNVETTEKVLRDVRHTIARLVREQFYPTLAAQAKQSGCQFSAESVAPTMIADGMEHYRLADLPMGEFWLNSPTHDKPNDMLDAISGAHIYGKNIVQAEGFTQLRGYFDETPARLKALLDRQYCLGINRLVFHVMALNPDTTRRPGMTLDGIGLFFNRTQPWWPEAADFVKYTERCQTLLQQGRPVVDLAVYTGHEMPRRAILPERIGIPAGYHYDSFNADALTHPVSNAFTPNYQVLLLPDARPMDPDHLPLPDSVRTALSQLSCPVLEGKISARQLEELGILPDAQLPDGMLFAHRSTPQSEIYFLSNQWDESRRMEVKLRDHHGLPAWLYDPLTDTYQSIQHNNGTLQLSLAAHGSCFILFSDVRFPRAEDPFIGTDTIQINPSGKIQLHFLTNGLQTGTDRLDFDWTSSTNDSLRYYSGRVRYSFDFRCDRSAQKSHLLFRNLHDVATVSLNGIPCGSVWTDPYRIDITHALRPGMNHMEIEVANTWNNAIEGHDSGHDPFPNIWTNAKYRKTERGLLPAGIGSLFIISVNSR